MCTATILPQSNIIKFAERLGNETKGRKNLTRARRKDDVMKISNITAQRAHSSAWFWTGSAQQEALTNCSWRQSGCANLIYCPFGGQQNQLQSLPIHPLLSPSPPLLRGVKTDSFIQEKWSKHDKQCERSINSLKMCFLFARVTTGCWLSLVRFATLLFTSALPRRVGKLKYRKDIRIQKAIEE